MTASNRSLTLDSKWTQSLFFIIVKCKLIFFHPVIGYTRLDSRVALWNERISLWEWPKTLARCPKLLANNASFQRVCSQVICYVFKIISCRLISKTCKRRFKIPSALRWGEVRVSASYCLTSSRNSSKKNFHTAEMSHRFAKPSCLHSLPCSLTRACNHLPAPFFWDPRWAHK